MVDWCIVVADGGRARLFTASLRAGANAARLQEREDLVEIERGLPAREIWADRSGQNRPGSGFDERRGRHREEVERKFAKRIVAAVANLVRRVPAEALVVVAEPRMLGMLRGPLDAALPSTLPRMEIGADLTWQALPHLQAVLAQHGALPERVPSHRARLAAAQAPHLAPAPPLLPRRPEPRDNGRPRRRRVAAV